GVSPGTKESAMRVAALMNCREWWVIARTRHSCGSDDDRKVVSLHAIARHVNIDLVDADHVRRQTGPQYRIRMTSDQHLNVFSCDRKRIHTREVTSLNIGSDRTQTSCIEQQRFIALGGIVRRHERKVRSMNDRGDLHPCDVEREHTRTRRRHRDLHSRTRLAEACGAYCERQPRSR